MLFCFLDPMKRIKMKVKDEFALNSWWDDLVESDIEKATEKIAGEKPDIEIQGIEIRKGRLACASKYVPKWIVGYQFYEKVPSVSSIINGINKKRKREKDITYWAVVLPPKYAKRFCAKLTSAGIHVVEEKKYNEVKVKTGGKLYKSLHLSVKRK